MCGTGPYPFTTASDREEEPKWEEPSVTVQLWQRLVGLALLLSVTACAGPEPVLRSNKQLQLYGKQAGQKDIEACQQQAEKAGLQPGVSRGANSASGGVLGLIIGGAIGASTGLIGGATGVAIGAAAGGGLGLLGGVIAGAYKPLEPEPPYADAVVRCLIGKGYEVSGWQ